MHINLGGLSPNNLSSTKGLASNIDTKAAIDREMVYLDAKLKRLNDNIEINDKKLEAYYELKDLMNKLKATADVLRNKQGFESENDNVFQMKKVIMNISNPIENANSYIKISAGPKVEPTEFSLSVEKIASGKKMISDSFTSDTISVVEAAQGTSNGLFSEGTISIGAQTINIRQGNNLKDIANAFNAVSAITNIKANVIKISDNSFKLYLESNKTGTINNFVINDPTNVLSQVAFNVTNATNAEFTYNGISMIRSTNNITDIIDGLNISLNRETKIDDIINIKVERDSESVEQVIRLFVESYNNLMSFLSTQQARDEYGKIKDTAILAKEQSIKTLAGELVGKLSFKSTNNLTIKDLGLSIFDIPANKDHEKIVNALEINESVFKSILNDDSINLRELFEFQYLAIPNVIGISKHKNNLSNINDFILKINNASIGEKVEINYEKNNINYIEYADYKVTDYGAMIKGRQNTILQNMEFIYGGDGTDNINITYSEGIADQIYNLLDEYLSDNGAISIAYQTIIDKNKDLEVNVESQTFENDKHRQRFAKKYADLESKIAKSNAMLDYLSAQINAYDKR